MMPIGALERIKGPGGLLSAVAVMLLTSTGVAQPPAQRTELRAFRDSVAAARDTAELREVESALMLEARRDRANAMLHLKLGVVAERFGAWRDAAAEYKWATDLESRWPEAWWGWALAELRIGDEVETAPTSRRLRLARDAWVRSAQAVARAVELDPAFGARAVREVAAAVAAGRSDWGGVLRDGLARPASRRDTDGEVLLALGRADLALGDSAGAVLAFDGAASLPGFRGLGLLERARTQLAAGDDRGIEAYYGGAAADDTAAVREYRRDLALIATDGELRRFDALAPVERPAFLWDLWTGRDRTDLRRNGERLMEHYRRMTVARRLYDTLDDLRARVLVRHGEPDGRASIRHASAPPNESWWYRRPERPFVVHFVARSDSTRYELVESLFEIGDAEAGGRARGSGESATAAPVDPDLLLRSRAQLAPFYQSAVEAKAGSSSGFRQQERLLGAAGQVAALETDAYPIRFTRELPARAQLAGFGGGPGESGVHLLVAIPGFATEPQGGEGMALYPIRVRAVVRDSGGAVARAIDTVLVVERDAPVPPAERLGSALWVPLEPGTYQVRAAVDHGPGGTIVGPREVSVPPVEPGRLALSDLLLASGRAAPLALELGVDTVPVDPAPVLARGDTLMVWGQLLAGQGERGRLRVLVRPVRGGGEAPERWRPFPGYSDWVPLELPAPGPGRTITLSLPLRRLAQGAHELQVVVIDGAGTTAWQQAAFEVEDRP